MVKAAAVRRYGHILQNEEDDIMKEAINFEIMEREIEEDQLLGWINRLKL